MSNINHLGSRYPPNRLSRVGGPGHQDRHRDNRRCHDYQRPALDQEQGQGRDPEMHQTKKGNQWYFGMKAHIGVDSQTKVIHAMAATAETKKGTDLFSFCNRRYLRYGQC